jgi:hypothetical protein
MYYSALIEMRNAGEAEEASSAIGTNNPQSQRQS